jgi:Protein of unknown function (DUF3107)
MICGVRRSKEGVLASPKGIIIVQVRVGVQLVPKELVVESKQTADEVEQSLAEALTSDSGLFVLKDSRGGRIVIPAKHVGYLEISEEESRQVGFGTL